jgi:hypothetical protein
VALGLITPLLFGLMPALQASRTELREALAEGGRSGAAPARSRVRSLLVAAEVAVALVLLVGAGLLIRSFVKVVSVDPGFDTAARSSPACRCRRRKYPDAPRSALFYSGLMERLRQLPGVAAAGAVTQAPFSGADHNGAFEIEGQTRRRTGRPCRTPAIASPRPVTSRRSASRCCRGARSTRAIARARSRRAS